MIGKEYCHKGENMKHKIVEIEPVVPHCKAFFFDDCKVFVGNEPEVGWHLSISHRRRFPSWAEVRDARYEFCPGNISMVMVFPPKEEYVNIHENCFHLYQGSV